MATDPNANLANAILQNLPIGQPPPRAVSVNVVHDVTGLVTCPRSHGSTVLDHLRWGLRDVVGGPWRGHVTCVAVELLAEHFQLDNVQPDFLR